MGKYLNRDADGAIWRSSDAEEGQGQAEEEGGEKEEIDAR